MESQENSPPSSHLSPLPSINYDVSFRNKTKTREERKMESIMKAIEAMEKKEARKRKDSEEKGKPDKKRRRSDSTKTGLSGAGESQDQSSADEGYVGLPSTSSDQAEAPEPAEPGSCDDLEDIDCLLYDSEDQE